MVSFVKKHEVLSGFIFFVALIAIVFLPVILNRQTFFSAIPGLATEKGPYGFTGLRTPWTLDPGAYMWTDVPQTIYWYQSLRDGIFPFWNPYQGLGVPLSGDILSAAYNPFKLLFFFLFPHLKTFDFYILFKLLVAGFGTFLLLKKYGLSQRASILGGVAYMFSGYFIQWLTHWSLAADMMTPYILLAIEHFFDRASLKNTALVSLSFLLMVLSGVPEGVVEIAFFTGLYFIFRLMVRKEKRGALLLKFAGAVFVALLLALPMLWDMYLYFANGLDSHAGMTAGFGMPFNFYPEKIIRVLRVFISPSIFLEAARMGGMYKTDFPIPYFGMTVLLLAIAGMSFRGRLKENMRPLFFGGYVLYFLLLLGGIPPFSWLEQLPLFSKMLFLKYSDTLYFGLAVLAAYGFWRIETSTVNKKKFCWISGALAAILASAFLFSGGFRAAYALHFDQESLAQINSQLAKLPQIGKNIVSYLVGHPYAYAVGVLALQIFIAATLFWLWLKKKTTGILILLILELFVYIPKVRDGGFRPFNPFNQPPFVKFLKSQPDIEQYRIFATERTLMPFAATAYGLRDFRTYNSLYVKRYVDFVKPVLGADWFQRMTKCWCIVFQTAEVNPVLAPMLNLGGVKYIISEELLPEGLPYKLIYDEEASPALDRETLNLSQGNSDSDGSAILQQQDIPRSGVKIYENSEALPPAYVLNGVKILKTAKITESSPNRVVIEVESPQNGKLIYGDSYYPGWKAEIDGKNVPIFPAYGLLKGVPVPAGRHTVVFSYNPLRPLKEAIKQYLF